MRNYLKKKTKKNYGSFLNNTSGSEKVIIFNMVFDLKFVFVAMVLVLTTMSFFCDFVHSSFSSIFVEARGGKVREVILITMSLFCTSCTYHERWQDSDIVTGHLCMKAVRPPGRPRVQCCDDSTVAWQKATRTDFFSIDLLYI